MNFKELKKVELHLHLDGSIRPSTLSDITGMDLEQAKNVLIAPNDCSNLNEYLTRFDVPTKIMRTKENISRISYELASDLESENVIYAEVRFAPNQHTDPLTLDEVVQSVLDGFNKSSIKINLILCMMRHHSYEDNKKIIELAFKYKDKGVCAIDLAGAEALYKTKDFEDLFSYAKKLGIKYTIHAGEADGCESIESALKFGTKRLGHGVRCIEDESIMEYIKNNDILLEVCPTSNVQTKIVNDINTHPIDKLYKYGIKLCINTDNRTVSNTTLTHEYEILCDAFNYTKEDFDTFNVNALKGSFIDEELRTELINLIRK